MKVVLVEPHKLVSEGIALLLSKVQSMEVVASLTSGKALSQYLTSNTADLFLISTNLTDMSLISLIKRIKRVNPAIKTVLLSDTISLAFAKRYINVGADGYIVKSVSSKELIDSLGQVMQNKTVLPNEIIQSLAQSRIDPNSEGAPFDQLSEREVDILLLMVTGKSIREISDILYLSPKTISTYKGRIYEKLSVKSVMELFLLALEYGIITEERAKH